MREAITLYMNRLVRSICFVSIYLQASFVLFIMFCSLSARSSGNHFTNIAKKLLNPILFYKINCYP